MGVIIAGDRSGAGKTTVTMALLAGLAQRGRLQSFKVGPDYIDPMFHRAITGRACRNLDVQLTSEAYVQTCFAKHTQSVEFVIVEGAMGLFDGFQGDWASTAHVARLLDLPVVLVLDCRSLSGSIAPIAWGFAKFDPRIKLAGVILNRVASDRHAQILQDALAATGIPILGLLRRSQEITLPERHLGLVPTGELPGFTEVIDRLAHLAATCFDWPRLLPLVEHRAPPQTSPEVKPLAPVRIAVAYDQAFNFYYQDNLELLASLGAELTYWSPLEDEKLPTHSQALYFGGGFPEMFAAPLAANQAAQNAIRGAIAQGVPVYAECGGLMYLSQAIQDFAGQAWPMVGVLPTAAVMGSSLTLGYRRAQVLHPSWLAVAGTTIWGHEFHRSHLTIAPQQPLWQTQNSQQQLDIEGWSLGTVHASYVHLHWGAMPEMAARFCAQASLVPASP